MSSDPPNSQLREQTPLRPVRLGPASVDIERRADGAMVLRSPRALEAYPEKLTERLAHWANAAPERIFLSQRDGAAGWRSLSYREAYASVRAIAAALLGGNSFDSNSTARRNNCGSTDVVLGGAP